MFTAQLLALQIIYLFTKTLLWSEIFIIIIIIISKLNLVKA